MSINLEIPSNFYNALRIVSAKNDVRYYLNGILIDFKKKRWVATDGHRLLVVPMDMEVCTWSAGVPDRLIIEKTRQKISGDTCKMHLDKHDGQWIINVCNMRGVTNIWQEVLGTIDGNFPDIDRVTPSWLKEDPTSVPLIAYNPQYMADVSKELGGHAQMVRVMPSGDANSSALVEFGGFTRDQLTYVLMPMKW